MFTTWRCSVAVATLSAALVVGLSGGVQAQSNAPLRLTPLPAPDAPSGGTGSTTPPGASGGAQQAVPAPGGSQRGGIVVQRLGGVDEDAVGVLAPDQGGLPFDVWRGSSRALVGDLLRGQSGNVTSLPLRDLLRRLLLTTAAPPDVAGGEETGGSLLAARVRLLVAMGAVDDANALIGAARRATPTGELAWPTLETRLLSGDAAGACAVVRARGNDLAGLDWQKALIFCQLLAEKADQAQFGLSLLRERSAPPDPLFFTLADALATGASASFTGTAPPGTATPLNLALLRLAWSQLPDGFVAAATPAVAAAVARAPDAPEAVRLAAAVRAEATGALSAADLRRQFGALKLTPQELAAALTIAETEAPARAIALLYRAALAEKVPAARAEVLQGLWQTASAHGLGGTASRVAAPLLTDVPLLPEFAWFAGAASRMSLYASDLPRALGWYEIAATAPANDSEAVAAAARLWPLVRLALGDTRRAPPEPSTPDAARAAGKEVVVIGGTVTTEVPVSIAETLPTQGEIALPWHRARIDAWLAADRQDKATGTAGNALRLFSLLDAVGDPVGDDLWRVTLPGNGGAVKADEVAPAYRLGMMRATAGTRGGEAILFVAAALDGREIGAADPVALHAIVRALARTGFGDTARALARDAALDAGL